MFQMAFDFMKDKAAQEIKTEGWDGTVNLRNDKIPISKKQLLRRNMSPAS